MRRLAALALIAACRGGHPPDPRTGSGGSAIVSPAATSVVPALPKSTRSSDELRIMDERVERNRDHPGIAIAALLDRATYLGRIDDYGDALDRSAVWIEKEPKSFDAWLMRVRALLAVHDFATARAAIATAAKLAPDPSHVEDVTLALDDATGARDRVLAAREAAARAYPNAVNLTLYAVALATAGRFDDAIAQIAPASKEIHNNTATIYAWLLFQWGRVYELKGDLGSARQFYVEAHARFPEYVEATAHLAQTMIATGDRDGATKLVAGELASWLAAESKGAGSTAGSAAASVAGSGSAANSSPPHPALIELGAQLGLVPAVRARVAWDRYVGALPLAFADHAARFYLGVGAEPKRALALAQQNLANRDVPEARALVVEAALAAVDPARASLDPARHSLDPAHASLDPVACTMAESLVGAPLRAHRFLAWRALSRPECHRADLAQRLAKDLGITP